MANQKMFCYQCSQAAGGVGCEEVLKSRYGIKLIGDPEEDINEILNVVCTGAHR